MCNMQVIFFCLAIATTLFQITRAINIDTTNPFTYASTTSGALFGYSVDIYKFTPTNSISVLIGAPRASSSQHTENSGVTYRCSYGALNNCSFLNLIDLTNPNKMLRPSQESDSFPVEDKSNMWLGVSVTSSPISGQILTCGHRFQDIGNQGLSRFVHGLCHFLPHIDSESLILNPCYLCSVRIDKYFLCQAGISVAFDDSGYNQLLGASSALSFRGTVFSGTDNTGCDQNIGDLTDTSDPVNLDVTQDALLGYQVTFGRVFDRNIVDMIVSMPRYSYLFGGMVFFRNDSGNIFRKERNITGSQLGAYMGFSLINIDLNKDGLDEIIIGSPLYSNEGAPEIGRVQIFSYISSSDSFKIIDLYSPKPSTYSRFGHSLASLGDLDKDGFPEFAVGEPLGSSSGKVYIFSGNGNGIKDGVFQVINGDDLPDSVTSFGSSISTGRDMDNNNYEDILIGAPLSDKAFLYHSRPVIRMNASIVSSIQEININNSARCPVDIDGVVINLICFDIDVYISYVGISVPSTVLIDLNLTLDTTLVANGVPFRLFFFNSPQKFNTHQITSYTVNLNDKNNVFTSKVYVEDILEDIHTPIFIEATYDIHPPTDTINYFNDVILLGDKKMTSSLIIRNIKCGTDNICDSDLSLTGYVQLPLDPFTNESFRNIIVNEVDSFILRFSARNAKEEAILPSLRIDLPKNVYFRREDGIGIRVEMREFLENGSRIVIDLGSSMSEDASLDIDIHISVNNTFQDVTNFEITTTITSVNPEESHLLIDNVVTFRLEIVSRAILKLHGSLRQDQIFYNNTNSLNSLSDFTKVKSFARIGSEIIHSYTITNLKSSSVNEIILTIHWPLGNMKTKEFILYITELYLNDMNAAISCDQTYVNVLTIDATNDHIQSIISNNKRRRDTEKIYEYSTSAVGSISNELTCNSNPELCVTINCFITNLPPSKNAQINVRSRIFESTLIKLASPTTIWKIGSHATYRVSNKGVNSVYLTPTKLPVTLVSTINPNEIVVNVGNLEWYHIVIMIVVIVVLVVIVIIIINLLYLCGFFKTKKYKKHELRGNGEYEEELDRQEIPHNNEIPMTVLEELEVDGHDTV